MVSLACSSSPFFRSGLSFFLRHAKAVNRESQLIGVIRTNVFRGGACPPSVKVFTGEICPGASAADGNRPLKVTVHAAACGARSSMPADPQEHAGWYVDRHVIQNAKHSRRTAMLLDLLGYQQEARRLATSVRASFGAGGPGMLLVRGSKICSPLRKSILPVDGRIVILDKALRSNIRAAACASTGARCRQNCPGPLDTVRQFHFAAAVSPPPQPTCPPPPPPI